MENVHQKNSQNFDNCMVYLRNSTLSLSGKQFALLINDSDHDPLTIKLLINYLEYWHDGQLNGLEHIPVLLHNANQQQDRGLKRLLVAFEHQFCDCAELTLLYLMGLWLSM